MTVLAGGVSGATRLPGLGVGALGPPLKTLLRLAPVRNQVGQVLATLARSLLALTPNR